MIGRVKDEAGLIATMFMKCPADDASRFPPGVPIITATSFKPTNFDCARYHKGVGILDVAKAIGSGKSLAEMLLI